MEIIEHQQLNHKKHFLFDENHVKDETLTKQNEIVNHNEDQNPKPEQRNTHTRKKTDGGQGD